MTLVILLNLAPTTTSFAGPATYFLWCGNSTTDYWDAASAWTSDATGDAYVDPVYGPIGPPDTPNKTLQIIFQGDTSELCYCDVNTWEFGTLQMNSTPIQVGYSPTDKTDGAALMLYGDGIINYSATGALITLTTHGSLEFFNSSTAGDISINSSSADQTNTYIKFHDSSTAGSTTFTVGINSYVLFSNSASAGNATLTTAGTNTSLQFSDTSTAGNATLGAIGAEGAGFNAGTYVGFSGSAHGGTATITAQNGGLVTFNDSSSADHATITSLSYYSYRSVWKTSLINPRCRAKLGGVTCP